MMRLLQFNNRVALSPCNRHRSEEAIEKRVAYNLTLKSIFKGIAIDWLANMLVLEFKDGTVRYLAEGQRVPTDIPNDFIVPDLE